MVTANGWALYEFPLFKRQKAKLDAQVAARKEADPQGWANSPDAKLSQAIEHLTLHVIPANPGAKHFRQGDTLGKARKHWFRAKFGNGRYRLFFQFNSRAKVIIYAWVNDEETLRTYGAKTDAYSVFRSMLAKGNPPDGWDDLARAVAAKIKPAASPKETASSKQAKGYKRKYFWLAALPIAVIIAMFVMLVDGAADLTTVKTENPNVNIQVLIISRIPYVAISLAIITACYKIARPFFNEMIRINSQRLNLTKISIIAKDVSSAAEHDLNLDDEDRYRLRTEFKMSLLKDHLKDYISRDFKVELPKRIVASLGFGEKGESKIELKEEKID